MTRERAKRIAAEWSFGGVCTLREGETAEYHKLFYDLICQQEQDRNEPITDRKQLTNADRIRAMSDEELAEFLGEPFCDKRTNDECRFTYLANCEKCRLEWIQQPVEDVEHENNT